MKYIYNIFTLSWSCLSCLNAHTTINIYTIIRHITVEKTLISYVIYYAVTIAMTYFICYLLCSYNSHDLFQLSEQSTINETICDCINPPGNSFATTFYVPPNTIDFGSVFSKFDLTNNAAVFSTVICLIVYFT
jgi:hypothetical protein